MPALEQSRSMVHRWSEPYPLSEYPRCKPTGNFPPISVIPGLWVHDLVDFEAAHDGVSFVLSRPLRRGRQRDNGHAGKQSRGLFPKLVLHSCAPISRRVRRSMRSMTGALSWSAQTLRKITAESSIDDCLERGRVERPRIVFYESLGGKRLLCRPVDLVGRETDRGERLGDID